MISRSGKKKSISIQKKMMVPMIVAAFLQAGVFYAAVRHGGTVTQMRRNAYELLDERVASRAHFVENEMVQRWSCLENTAKELSGVFSAFQSESPCDAAALAADPDLASAYLTAASPYIISLLEQNTVTGAFVILGDSGAGSGQGKSVHSGLYLRDLDPDYHAEDQSDLLVEAGPPSVTRQLKIPMDALWTAQIDIDLQSGGQGDFFYKPWNAALRRPDISGDNLGYWSLPFRRVEDDIEIISYTVPLTGEDRRPFGVLGVEISLDYLREIIPYIELDSAHRGAYLLAVSKDGGMEFDNVLANGPLYQRLTGGGKTTRFSAKELYADSRLLENGKHERGNGVGCIHYLQLYNTNTPFENERWALIGIMAQKDMREDVNRLNMNLLLSLAGSLLVGGVGAACTAAVMTRPITFLAKKLRESNPCMPVKLEKLHVTEIDELSGAIENLSTSVADSASKLTKLIELSDIALGAFELDMGTRQIFYVGKLFRMLGIAPEGESGYVEIMEFRSRFESLCITVEEVSPDATERICRAEPDGEEKIWFRLKIVEGPVRLLGVLVDVTRDVIEKRKIEYERDYDHLTNLLNRRAFYAAAAKRFEHPALMKTAALIMLDLDNLKFVNDTYGHDYGDAYIRRAASVLSKPGDDAALVSRMSGDEFLVLLDGYDSKAEARQVIDSLRERLLNAAMPLPDGEEIRIRASAGVAWYPQDSESLEMLVKYADFAMYMVKNTEKGAFNNFNVSRYNRESPKEPSAGPECGADYVPVPKRHAYSPQMDTR